MKVKATNIFSGLRLFDWVLILGVTVCTIIYSCFSTDSFSDFDWLGTLVAVTGIFSVVLTTHRNIFNYAFGLVNVAAYAYVAYKSNLLGDCLIYAFYYLPMQILGWISWSRNSLEEDASTVSSFRMNWKGRTVTGTVSAIATIGLGLCLLWLKNMAVDHPFIAQWHLFSEFPFRDAVTTVFSAVGMYLMVKAYAEQWFFWIAVDVVSISIWVMFAIQGTPHAAVMVIMYVFYLANCINGAMQWRR